MHVFKTDGFVYTKSTFLKNRTARKVLKKKLRHENGVVIPYSVFEGCTLRKHVILRKHANRVDESIGFKKTCKRCKREHRFRNRNVCFWKHQHANRVGESNILKKQKVDFAFTLEIYNSKCMFLKPSKPFEGEQHFWQTERRLTYLTAFLKVEKVWKRDFEGMPQLFWPLSIAYAKTNRKWKSAKVQSSLQKVLLNEESDGGQSGKYDTMVVFEGSFLGRGSEKLDLVYTKPSVLKTHL